MNIDRGQFRQRKDGWMAGRYRKVDDRCMIYGWHVDKDR